MLKYVLLQANSHSMEASLIAEKVDISGKAALLWCKLLTKEDEIFPNWEIKERDDVKELVEKGLAKVVERGGTRRSLVLIDERYCLSQDEEKLMRLLLTKEKPISIKDLLKEAEKFKIQHALRTTRKLIAYSLVKFVDKENCSIKATFSLC